MITGLFESHLPVKDLGRSVAFYQRIGLELAHQRDKLALLWIERGKSWLGLWESDQVSLPYHPSIRHVAFRVDLDALDSAAEWLRERGIEVREEFGFSPERQPLVLSDNPQAMAAIYFHDPDGNSLEFIAPLRIDVEEEFAMMTLEDWYRLKGRPVTPARQSRSG
jgi:catechol 2,3-dioxygenase-like lactoylglutathione lyase family enzyme